MASGTGRDLIHLPPGQDGPWKMAQIKETFAPVTSECCSRKESHLSLLELGLSSNTCPVCWPHLFIPVPSLPFPMF